MRSDLPLENDDLIFARIRLDRERACGVGPAFRGWSVPSIQDEGHLRIRHGLAVQGDDSLYRSEFAPASGYTSNQRDQAPDEHAANDG
jgi:hypothetical protein